MVDHVQFTNPSTDISVDGCWSSIGRYVDRCVDRYVGRYVDRYVGRYSGRNWADTLTVEYRSSVGGLSVECRWSIGRLFYKIRKKKKEEKRKGKAK